MDRGLGLSLVIAYSLGGILAAFGVVVSLVYVGSALATTAIGTLIPVLSDTGELGTDFGRYLLAAGAVGEFGPILLLTLVLSTQSAVHNALILVAFVALAVGVAVLAVRSAGRTIPLLERTIETSSQLAVRWIVVLVFALALLAAELGLDLLLGGFAAGLITRQTLRAREIPFFDSKLAAVAFGVFIPFFFVVSGMRLDVDALFASVRASRRWRFSSCCSWSSAARRRCFFTGACSRSGRTARRWRCSRRRSSRWSSRSRPSPSTAATCAPRRRPPWSAPARCRRSPGRCTACGCAAIAAERRATAEAAEVAGRRVSHPDAHHEIRAAGRLFRLRIWLSSAMWVPVLAANVVAVALGIGLPILDEHLGDQTQLAAGRYVGAGDLRRARRRDDHVHRDRVLRGVRRRPDPDVVLLAAARRAAAPRPGGDRRPRAADRHRDLLALRARGARPPADRAGRDFVPAATVSAGSLLR